VNMIKFKFRDPVQRYVKLIQFTNTHKTQSSFLATRNQVFCVQNWMSSMAAVKP
jgi:hypothetical protein